MRLPRQVPITKHLPRNYIPIPNICLNMRTIPSELHACLARYKIYEFVPATVMLRS